MALTQAQFDPLRGVPTLRLVARKKHSGFRDFSAICRADEPAGRYPPRNVGLRYRLSDLRVFMLKSVPFGTSTISKDIGENRSIADAGRLIFPGAGKCDDIAGWRV